MKQLDELSFREWAVAVVDDQPEEHAQDGHASPAPYRWPQRTVEAFARLLEFAR